MADVVEEKEISLIVEDGSCVPNANCYVSLDFADEYMHNTGKTGWDLCLEKLLSKRYEAITA